MTNEVKFKIIMASRDLFFKFGIKRMTMDEISKHLGISKKTMYQYFEDKNAIVDELCTWILNDQQCAFADLCKPRNNPIEEMFSVAEHMTKVLGQINPIFFMDLQKFHPKTWARYDEFKTGKVFDLLVQNLETGVKDGFYRSDLNIKLLAKYRLMQVDLLFNPDCLWGDKANLAEINAVLLDNFMHGITTLKGHKWINKYRQIHEDDEE